MKHRLATMSETRVWARKVIDQVIADHVLGPVQSLKKEDVLELRKVIRTSVPLHGLSVWEIRCLREEFRTVLGYPPKRKPKMRRIHGLHERDILPSMVPWARKNGLIREPETASL